MAFDNIYVKASTSVIIQTMLRDSTTGMGKTGLVYSGVSASYCRPGATRQAITLISGAAGDAFSSGKFAEVDATNMPGLYQLHVPDASLASGANSVEFSIKGTGVLDKSVKIVLIDSNLRDAQRLGLASLPNVNAGASSGLPLAVDASGRVDVLKVNGTSQTAGDIYGKIISLLSANGNIKSTLVEVLTTALTETNAGNLSTAFKKFFDILSPVMTTAGINQTGDGYAESILIYNIVKATGTGDNAAILAILQNAGYGNSALATMIQNITNNTFISTDIPLILERPDSGSVSIPITILFSDDTGAAKNLDSGNPTIALTNDAGTNLNSRLSGSWTNPATGKYVTSYTSSVGDAIEGLHWDISGTINSKLRRQVQSTQIVDTTAVSFTSSDRTLLTQVNTRLGIPSSTVYSEMAKASGTKGTDAIYDKLYIHSEGKVVYVDPAKSDSNDGLTFSTAVATIAHACSMFIEGEYGQIRLKGAAYTEHGFTTPNDVELISFDGVALFNFVGISGDNAHPIINMGLRSTLTSLRFVASPFTTSLYAIIKMNKGCTVKDCSGYATGSGSVQMFIDSEGWQDQHILENTLGGGCIVNAVGNVDSGSVVRIEDNTMNGFIGDFIDFSLGGYSSIIRNRFFNVLSGKYAIRLTQNTGMYASENSFSGSGQMFYEVPHAGADINILINNNQWSTALTPQQISDASLLPPTGKSHSLYDFTSETKALLSQGFPDAKVFYVDGRISSSSGDGLSWSTPKKTITEAMALVLPGRGDTVFVKPTNNASWFHENITVPISTKLIGLITAGDFVEIRGYALNTPTLILMQGSLVSNIRVGDTGNNTGNIIKMYDGSKLINCNTGGIDGNPLYLLYVDGNTCEVSGNNFNGTESQNGIFINGDYCCITENVITDITGDHIIVNAFNSVIEYNNLMNIATGKFGIKSGFSNSSQALDRMTEAAMNNWSGSGIFQDPLFTASTNLNSFQNNEQWMKANTTVDGSFDIVKTLKELLAKATGNPIKNGNDYLYHDKATSALLFTLTINGNTVTRS